MLHRVCLVYPVYPVQWVRFSDAILSCLGVWV